MKKNSQETQVNQTDERTEPADRKKKRPFTLLVFLVLALLAIILLLRPLFQVKSEVSKSIAVLPFKFIGEDTTDHYWADGMRLAIHQKLGGIGDLRVIPWTTMDH